jgi:hypothetical protein
MRGILNLKRKSVVPDTASLFPDVAFTPDDSVHVHAEGAIRLICSSFRSHEDGLPEWIKNSSDMYTRVDAPPDARAILVLMQDKEGANPPMVACLDFGGMSTADIEQRFRNWADPDAAGDAGIVEGGHGNGGKCYMTQLFDEYSYIHTVSQGRGNRYGFKRGNFQPGYFPSPSQGRGYKVDDPDSELQKALEPFHLPIADLPVPARTAWSRSRGFTLVLGVGAKSLSRGRFPVRQWIDKLRGHQQMVWSLQRNKVFLFHNGQLQPTADPLLLDEIRPIPGAEVPRTIPIPQELTDPSTGEEVDTGAVEGTSKLVLRTSDVSMRWSLKARHTVNGWTHAGRSTGYWEVPTLSRSGYADKIYGDVYLDSLENYKQNDRRNHSDAPLTRALREWISQQIELYCSEFVKLDRLQATKEERDELKRLNDQMNTWKNRFLDREFGGVGDGGSGGTGTKPRTRLPRGEVARLVLTFNHTHAGQGVTFRPTLDFFDAVGTRVRAVPYEWNSTDWAVATIDDELNMITTHAPGKAEITAFCKDSGICSNPVTIEVLDITAIDLSPTHLEIRAGGRQPITATVKTNDGRTLQGVYLIWTEDDPTIVSVGSGGMVFGLTAGQTDIAAGDNQAISTTPARVTVLHRDEKGKDGGSGFPRILLSEIDDDPLGEMPPVFSEAEPPVYQRVQDVDHNLWWINMASPLARRYVDTARGGGSNSSGWRVYLLERYIEVMVKILLTYDFTHGQELSFETMLRRWEEESVVMQQRAVSSLQQFLEGGETEAHA